MALSWKAIRRGKIYCAPACGAGCTWAAFELANRRAAALVRKLSKGDLEWEPRVWENMGWHFSARSLCKRFDVSEHRHGNKVTGYAAFLNVPSEMPGGKWVGKSDTPLEAVEDARRQAREHLEKYVVCVDMKLVPITEDGDEADVQAG